MLLLALHTGAELLDWADVGRDWVGLIGLLVMVGAVGFRVLVLGRVAALDHGGGNAEPREVVFRTAARNAATVGAAGTVAVAIAVIAGVVGAGEEAGAHGTAAVLTDTALVLAFVGFVLARATARRGGVAAWYLAGCGAAYVALGDALSALVHGRLPGVVNPVHAVGGALWLGTLFTLVVAGIPAVLNRATLHEYRGPLVADLVSAFSPVALWSAAVLGVTGVITAWRHLKYFAALWTTAYGETLVVKLCLVVIVLTLGAWNWRRMRPVLGDEPAAYAIRRSATAELAFAAVVLAVTAVLINLPTPKAPAALGTTRGATPAPR